MSSATGSKNGASVASMTGTCYDDTTEERCIDVLTVISGGLQIYRDASRKHDNKCSLKSRRYFQCSETDAAADAGMNAVPKINANGKLRT